MNFVSAVVLLGSMWITHPPVDPSSLGRNEARSQEHDVYLTTVRTVTVLADGSAPKQSELNEVLSQWLPSVAFGHTDSPDLVVEFGYAAIRDGGAFLDHVVEPISTDSEVVTSFEDLLPLPSIDLSEWRMANVPRPREEATESVYWSASLFRMDCQHSELGVKPTRPVDGACARPVFVKVDLATLHGRAADHDSAVQALAVALRDAIIRSPVTVDPPRE